MTYRDPVTGLVYRTGRRQGDAFAPTDLPPYDRSLDDVGHVTGPCGWNYTLLKQSGTGHLYVRRITGQDPYIRRLYLLGD